MRLIFIATAVLMNVFFACGRTGEGIPDIPGAGLSGHYVAVLDGVLTVAGGANFPDRPPYEGGKKAFYADILTLEGGEWKTSGALPASSAYGAFASSGEKLFVAGGAGGNGETASFVCVSLKGGKAEVFDLPSLPAAVQQCGGAVEGDYFYLAGGFNAGGPFTDVMRFDFKENAWQVLAQLPEPMVQPVVAVRNGVLYVWGGFNPDEKKALDYGYRFADGRWGRIPGLPDGGTMTGSAYAVSDARLYVTGGVDADVFNAAIALPPEKIREYQTRPVEYYNFRNDVYCFDFETELWSLVAAGCNGTARAGAACVVSDGMLINVNGELKPVVRSSEITCLKL